MKVENYAEYVCLQEKRHRGKDHVPRVAGGNRTIRLQNTHQAADVAK